MENFKWEVRALTENDAAWAYGYRWDVREYVRVDGAWWYSGNGHYGETMADITEWIITYGGKLPSDAVDILEV